MRSIGDRGEATSRRVLASTRYARPRRQRGRAGPQTPRAQHVRLRRPRRTRHAPARPHAQAHTRKEARLACVDSACRTGRAHAREVSAPRAPSIRSIRTPAAARHRGRGRTPTCGALREQGNHWAGSVDREPPSARHAERTPRRLVRYARLRGHNNASRSLRDSSDAVDGKWRL